GAVAPAERARALGVGTGPIDPRPPSALRGAGAGRPLRAAAAAEPRSTGLGRAGHALAARARGPRRPLAPGAGALAGAGAGPLRAGAAPARAVLALLVDVTRRAGLGGHRANAPIGPRVPSARGAASAR